MKVIGVQKGLSTVSDYLSQQGYSVRSLDENVESASEKNVFDAIVVADYNTDFLGYSDTYTKVPVINSSGLTPEEVKKLIDQSPSK